MHKMYLKEKQKKLTGTLEAGAGFSPSAFVAGRVVSLFFSGFLLLDFDSGCTPTEPAPASYSYTDQNGQVSLVIYHLIPPLDNVKGR